MVSFSELEGIGGKKNYIHFQKFNSRIVFFPMPDRTSLANYIVGGGHEDTPSKLDLNNSW